MQNSLNPRWHALQTQWRHEVQAAAFAVRQGYEAYLPTMQRQRHHNHRIETVTVPRFPTYLFVRFGRSDPWGALVHDEGKFAGIIRVLHNCDGEPIPVPEEAMEAMRAYEPPPPEKPRSPKVFAIGEPVIVHSGDAQQEAVFVAYERGKARVLLWFLGAERIVPVALTSLEAVT